MSVLKSIWIGLVSVTTAILSAFRGCPHTVWRARRTIFWWLFALLAYPLFALWAVGQVKQRRLDSDDCPPEILMIGLICWSFGSLVAVGIIISVLQGGA